MEALRNSAGAAVLAALLSLLILPAEGALCMGVGVLALSLAVNGWEAAQGGVRVNPRPSTPKPNVRPPPQRPRTPPARKDALRRLTPERGAGRPRRAR